MDQPPGLSDAIVVLGEDNYNADRAARAAQLFKDGWAPRVVASGKYLRPYASIAELEQHDLADRGVPMKAIIPLAHRAENTREEAYAIGQLLRSRRWKRILLVTSNYHTRRAQFICSRAFPTGTALQVIAAPDSEYDPDGWWRTRKGTKIFFYESVSMLLALWEMRQRDSRTSEILAPSVAVSLRGDGLRIRGPFTPSVLCTILR